MPGQRKYDYRHKQLRASYAKKVEKGLVGCSRCGRLIVPGEPWDLGHDDLDRSVYTGPEHRACNRATSSHRKQRAVRPASRRW